MDRNKTTLEPAFELAASGVVKQVDHIRTLLKREGYDQRQVEGPAINKQLRKIFAKAREHAHRA